MSLFPDLLKKFGSRLSALSAKLPDANTLRKGTKAVAIISCAALLGRIGQIVMEKARSKVDESIAQAKAEGVEEIKSNVSKSLEKFVFECILRWVLYIALILLAYAAAKNFNLRRDVLVAFVILGIYSFYVIKFMRMCRWYFSFCGLHGWMISPYQIIREYLHKAILDEVQRTRDALWLPTRLAMNFFGPDSDKIAKEMTDSSIQSAELRRQVIARTVMLLCGWIVYALIYEKLFLMVTGIDFQAIWEPLIWPFHVFIKILSLP